MHLYWERPDYSHGTWDTCSCSVDTVSQASSVARELGAEDMVLSNIEGEAIGEHFDDEGFDAH